MKTELFIVINFLINFEPKYCINEHITNSASQRNVYSTFCHFKITLNLQFWTTINYTLYLHVNRNFKLQLLQDINDNSYIYIKFNFKITNQQILFIGKKNVIFSYRYFLNHISYNLNC